MYHARSISLERKSCGSSMSPAPASSDGVLPAGIHTESTNIHHIHAWLAAHITDTQSTYTNTDSTNTQLAEISQFPMQAEERPPHSGKTGETAHARPALFILLPFFSHTCSSLNQLNPSLFPILYSFPKHPAKSLCNPQILFCCIP